MMKLPFLLVVFLLRSWPIAADGSELCAMTEAGVPCPTECYWSWWTSAYYCDLDDGKVKCLDEKVDCPETTEVDSPTTTSSTTTTTTTEMTTTTTTRKPTTPSTSTKKRRTRRTTTEQPTTSTNPTEKLTTPTTTTQEPTTPTTTTTTQNAMTSTTTARKSTTIKTVTKVVLTTTTPIPTTGTIKVSALPASSEEHVSSPTTTEAPSAAGSSAKVAEPAPVVPSDDPVQPKTTDSTHHLHKSKAASTSTAAEDIEGKILSSARDTEFLSEDLESDDEITEEEEEAEAVIYAAVWAFVGVAVLVFVVFGVYLGIRKIRSTSRVESLAEEQIIQKQEFNDVASIQERMGQGDSAAAQVKVETKDETKI